jgi:arsenate reductase (thioredoxin)
MFYLILPSLLLPNLLLSNLLLCDTGESTLLPKVDKYVEARLTEFDQISEERKQLLAKFAEYIMQCRREERPCNLVFICTHNSRRSHLSQAWAQVAAARYGISNVKCYSGGTSVTALNPRTVAVLKRAGVQVMPSLDIETSANPKYELRFQQEGDATAYFSKRFDDPSNPTKDFAAIMTCSDADRACPTVTGSSMRIAIPFDDPKVSDNTSDETKVYDLRCRQIACEMLYTMSLVANAETKIAETK